jgi:hypothetical protein
MSLKTRKRKIISETEHHDNVALRLAGIGATDYPELATLGSTLPYQIMWVITAVHLIYLPLCIEPISFSLGSSSLVHAGECLSVADLQITGCSMLTCNFGSDDDDTWFRPFPFQGKLLDWGLFDRWTSSPRQGCEADIDFPQQLNGGLAVVDGVSSYLCPHAYSPQMPLLICQDCHSGTLSAFFNNSALIETQGCR